jgi:hypothetical protein
MKSNFPAATHATKGPSARWLRPSSWMLRFAQHDGRRQWLVWGLALGSLLLAPRSLAAEPVAIDPGLGYLRLDSTVQSAADLRTALLQPRALILDLRYAADEPGAATALLELNSQPAKPMLYVLVSPATPVTVAEALTRTSTRLVLLGVKGSRPGASVVVEQSADTDRRAYAAGQAAAAFPDLISGKVEKEHFDEAQLVQEFKNGNRDAHPAEGNPDATTLPPERLTDRVLQRAVQLHRALQALQR